MKLIKNIKDLIFLERYLESVSFYELEIEDKSIAVGGYGKIYRIENGLPLNSPGEWVVKISFDDEKANRTGYRSMKELFVKMKDFQRLNFSDPLEMLATYPPLIGFPEVMFEGELEGNRIYCYIMPDLNSLGFTLFDEVLTDDPLHEKYISGLFVKGDVQFRIRCIYQLAKTFNLLVNKFNFIHGDIKAKSIWIHNVEPRVALIDFDGGHFYQQWNIFSTNKSVVIDVPIWGERQEWLAPEILRKINLDAASAKMEVSIASEAWSFACGIFQMLTGLGPYAFLKELQFGTLSLYHENNVWPSTISEKSLFKETATLDFYNQLTGVLEKYHELWEALSSVFNKGFSKPKSRISFNDWEVICYRLVKIKEPVVDFSVSVPRVLEGDSCTIAWNIDCGIVKLNGQLVNNNSHVTKEWDRAPQLMVINEFEKWTFTAPVEIVRKVKVISCALSENTVKHGSTVKIMWHAENVASVSLVRKGKPSEVMTNEIEVVPEKGETFEMIFRSKHGLHFEQITLQPKVVEPIIIHYFTSDRKFIAETLPVQLSWSVENAENMELSGIQRLSDSIGLLQIRPLKSIEYILVAKNEFFEETRSVYIEVMSIPKINLKIPELPKLNITLPDLVNQVPDIMSETAKMKKWLKDLFDL